MERENRVVVLIDMDCFYCQVEEKLNPDLKDKPIAVVQYNPWKGGGIIAVNYVARAMGVTRHMRGDEAKEKCPEIQLPSVPCQRGKADISKYREAGKDVARVLQKFTTLLERASIDEAYLDITTAVNEKLKSFNIQHTTPEIMPNTFALGYDNMEEFVRDVQSGCCDNIDFDYVHAKQLLVGAIIVSEIRAAVYSETGYRCSAGIAHNKILAKLVCGMNKPNKQTVLPKHCINILYKTLSIKKVKHMGGKFGDCVCERLKVSKMGELQKFSEKELQNKFDEKNGTWLYNIARGIDLEPVQARFNPKSIGCCKQFKGKSALTDLESLKKWLKDLGDEIEDRLEKDALENNRTPKQVVVSFSCQLPSGRDSSSSRSYNFTAEDELCGELFSAKAFELIMDSTEGGGNQNDTETNRRLPMPIKFLGISVGKFEDNDSKKTRNIKDFFSAGPSKQNKDEGPKSNESETEHSQAQPTVAPEDKDNVKNKDNVDESKEDTRTRSSKNNNTDRAFILQKFFKATEATKKENNTISPVLNLPKVESCLDKQESFFAKYLNEKATAIEKNYSLKMYDSDGNRPTTPFCKVIECGDNSNDSDFSGSTINLEINKSISLFEDDPRDVEKVAQIRNLMSTSAQVVTGAILEDERSSSNVSPAINDSNRVSPVINIELGASASPVQVVETFECEQCKKTLPITAFEIHADYHLALQLREEERQIARREKQARVETQKKAESPKIEKKEAKPESNSSIASFLIKVDDSAPTETCAECKKRIPIEKFAEHLDFHEAQKLSRELNRKPVVSNFAPNSVKRKKKTLSPDKKSKMMCKPINSFFN